MILRSIKFLCVPISIILTYKIGLSIQFLPHPSICWLLSKIYMNNTHISIWPKHTHNNILFTRMEAFSDSFKSQENTKTHACDLKITHIKQNEIKREQIYCTLWVIPWSGNIGVINPNVISTLHSRHWGFYIIFYFRTNRPAFAANLFYSKEIRTFWKRKISSKISKSLSLKFYIFESDHWILYIMYWIYCRIAYDSH